MKTDPPADIPFVDLQAQRDRLGGRIEAAIERVLAHGRFIMGPEVPALEEALSAYCGTAHCVSCASGTDALQLVLMAEEIGPGDAVFIPAFTFAATAEAVCLAGATPVFCDVLADTYNMDPESLLAAIAHAEKEGLRAKAVLPVDLFGQPADYAAIGKIAADRNLILFPDAAQSFGAELAGRKVGTFGKATSVSFFPSKPLGCYGDGGAILTDDAEFAARLGSLRMHGKGTSKYDNVRVGTNSRLDTIQAAILLEKLSIFDEELDARRGIAKRYSAALTERNTPRVIGGALSAWAQYTLAEEGRDALMAHLGAAGIPTVVYYPGAVCDQAAYTGFPVSPTGVAVSQRLAASVVSLPMHPYLGTDVQDRIIREIQAFNG